MAESIIEISRGSQGRVTEYKSLEDHRAESVIQITRGSKGEVYNTNL